MREDELLKPRRRHSVDPARWVSGEQWMTAPIDEPVAVITGEIRRREHMTRESDAKASDDLTGTADSRPTTAPLCRDAQRHRRGAGVDVLAPRRRRVPVAPTLIDQFPEADRQLRHLGASAPWIHVGRIGDGLGHRQPAPANEPETDPDQAIAPAMGISLAGLPPISRRTALRTVAGLGIASAAAFAATRLPAAQLTSSSSDQVAMSVSSRTQPRRKANRQPAKSPNGSDVPVVPVGYALTAKSNQQMLDSAEVPDQSLAQRLRRDTGATIYAGYLNLWTADDFRMIGSIFEGLLPIHGDRGDVGDGDGAGAHRGRQSVAWAQQAGFVRGTLIALDVEESSYEAAPDQALAFIQAWVRVLHAAGFRAAVYSGHPCLQAIAGAGHDVPDAAWVAHWFWDVYQGHEVSKDQANPADESSMRGLWPGRLGWQYANGYADGFEIDFSVCQPGMGFFSYGNRTVE